MSRTLSIGLVLVGWTLGAPSVALAGTKLVAGAGCVKSDSACREVAAGGDIQTQAVFVAGKGGATLEFSDKSTVRLPEGAEAKPLPRTKVALSGKDDTPAEALQVVRGKAFVTMPANNKGAFLLKTSHQSTGVLKKGSAVMKVSDESVVLAVFQGSGVLGSGSDYGDVLAGKVRIQRRGEAKSVVRELLGAPELKADQTVALKMGGTGAAPLRLSWKTLPQADAYEIEARPSKGQPVTIRKTKGSSDHALEGLDPGLYEVAVRGVDAEDFEGPWSAPVKLNVVAIELPQGASAQGNLIQLPEKRKIKLKYTDGLETSFDTLTVFVPAPSEVGLATGQPQVLRIRRKGETSEVQAKMIPRSFEAQVELGPRNARWPGAAVQVDVHLVAQSGGAVPADVQVIPKVTIDLDPQNLNWSREGGHLRASVPPRDDGRPHVVRVEVFDQYGFFLGRNHLEVAGRLKNPTWLKGAFWQRSIHAGMSTSRDPSSLGKYRVIAELGHGGMADVYLAVVRGPVGFSKLVVIKQLRPHLAEVPDFLDMFLDEARLAARLNHPNVVQTNEVVEDGNRYFIAMEYLDGQSFDRVLRRSQKETPERLTLAHKLRVLIETLEGLHYAHELCDFDGTPLRVVHRDVTPHNVFVTYEGQVKVVDFGIAKAANCSAETRTGVLKGKVAFMAPEQARGDEVDRRADVFSVGLMLWEVAVGARPWKGLNDIQILSRLSMGQVPAPSTAKPGIDPELERIILRATASDREQRYASAAQMREELDRYVERAGLRSAPRDLGAVTSDLFQDRRTEIRSLIDSQLRSARSMPTGEYQAMKPVSLVDMSGATGSVSAVTSLPSLKDGEDGNEAPTTAHTPAGRTGSRPGVSASLPPDPPAAPRSNKALPIGIAAVAGVLLIGAGAFALRGSSSSKDAAAAAPPPASTPAPAGGDAQGLCEFKIKASPPETRLFLDGAQLPTNPYSTRFRRDGVARQLRAEAPGFTTRTELVTCTDNVNLDIQLTPAPQAASAEPTAKTAQKGGPAQVAPRGAGPRPPETATDPSLPPPKVKRGDKRQLDGDDPWAK